MIKRRIAFYVPRINHLKMVAPVISYMLRFCPEKFDIWVLLPTWKMSKPKLQPAPNHIRELFGDAINLCVMEDEDHFAPSLKSNSIEAVLTVCPQLAEIEHYSAERIILAAKMNGIRWVALPHTFEAELAIVTDPASIVRLWDVICVLGLKSTEFVDLNLKDISPGLSRAVRERLVIVGYPEFDGMNGMDGDNIRDKYGLPRTKPIIFLATAPTFYSLLSGGMCLRGLEIRFRGSQNLSAVNIAARIASYRFPCVIPYYRYLSTLRDFARMNNAYVVAKTREKHRDPDYVGDYVDYVIGDVSYFPFTTLELLRVSTLYFGFFSAAAIEAIAMGVYAITALFVPPNIIGPTDIRNRYIRHYYTNRGGLWNTGSVSHLIHGCERSEYRVLEDLRLSDLADYKVDEEERIKLLDNFVSFRGRSSERFVDVLCSLW